MKFINTYIYQPSYLTYFGLLAFSIGSIVFSFIIPVTFDKIICIIFTIFWLCCLCKMLYLKNKLMVGVNAEGFCIWQSAHYLKKRDQYLFLPWAGINKIQIKQVVVNHQKYNYVYISYRQGGVLSVAASSTYAKPGKEIDLEVVSMVPSYQRYFEFYIPLDHIKGFNATIDALSKNYPLLEKKQDRSTFPKN